jgi:hypothetical protein
MLTTVPQSFITWLGVLINSALVYLFNPSTGTFSSAFSNATSIPEAFIDVRGNATANAAFPVTGAEPPFHADRQTFFGGLHGKGSTIMLPAVVIALLASHGYIVIRSVVRHVLERALWLGSAEEIIVEKREREMREATVRSASLEGDRTLLSPDDAVNTAMTDIVAGDGFWVDQGLEEITNAAKLD